MQPPGQISSPSDDISPFSHYNNYLFAKLRNLKVMVTARLEWLCTIHSRRLHYRAPSLRESRLHLHCFPNSTTLSAPGCSEQFNEETEFFLYLSTIPEDNEYEQLWKPLHNLSTPRSSSSSKPRSPPNPFTRLEGCR